MFWLVAAVFSAIILWLKIWRFLISTGATSLGTNSAEGEADGEGLTLAEETTVAAAEGEGF